MRDIMLPKYLCRLRDPFCGKFEKTTARAGWISAPPSGWTKRAKTGFVGKLQRIIPTSKAYQATVEIVCNTAQKGVTSGPPNYNV
jgi:hypothetical protein